MNAYLLGCIEVDRCLALQERLVYESGEHASPQDSLLICQHPPSISVGRCGSRAHVRLSERELASRRIGVQWIGRGGGAVLHGPGQLAVYPIVSLNRSQWTVGEYLNRFLKGLLEAFQSSGLSAQVRDNFSVWGRTGALATMGVAVRYDTTMHGAWLNLNPDMYLMRRVESLAYLEASSDSKPYLSSVLSESGRPTKITRMRTALIEALSSAFSAETVHMHTGHPSLQSDRLAT